MELISVQYATSWLQHGCFMGSKMRNRVRNCDCNFLALRWSFYAVKASYRSLSPPVFRFLVYTSLHFAIDIAFSKILRYVGEHRRALGYVRKYCIWNSIIITIFYCRLMVHITDTRAQKVVCYTSSHITETVFAHDQHWERQSTFSSPQLHHHSQEHKKWITIQ